MCHSQLRPALFNTVCKIQDRKVTRQETCCRVPIYELPCYELSCSERCRCDETLQLFELWHPWIPSRCVRTLLTF